MFLLPLTCKLINEFYSLMMAYLLTSTQWMWIVCLLEWFYNAKWASLNFPARKNKCKIQSRNWSVGLDAEAMRFSLLFAPSYRDLDTVDSMPFVYCYSLIDLILYSFIQLTFTENIACASNYAQHWNRANR